MPRRSWFSNGIALDGLNMERCLNSLRPSTAGRRISWIVFTGPQRSRRRGKRLRAPPPIRGGDRQRGERVERPFAHLFETGRLRRLHVRGRENVQKKLLLQAVACNAPLLLRQKWGGGHAARAPVSGDE